jgi:hypothetical protein
MKYLSGRVNARIVVDYLFLKLFTGRPKLGRYPVSP